jgi:hypothetical protein
LKNRFAGGRNAMVIYQDLVRLYSFTHRYNSVKWFLGLLRKKDPERYDRLEFLVGEQAQADCYRVLCKSEFEFLFLSGIYFCPP